MTQRQAIEATLTAMSREWSAPHKPRSIAAMTESERLDLLADLTERQHRTMQQRFVSSATPDYYYDSQRWQSSSRAGQFRREWLRYLADAGVFE